MINDIFTDILPCIIFFFTCIMVSLRGFSLAQYKNQTPSFKGHANIFSNLQSPADAPRHSWVGHVLHSATSSSSSLHHLYSQSILPHEASVSGPLVPFLPSCQTYLQFITLLLWFLISPPYFLPLILPLDLIHLTISLLPFLCIIRFFPFPSQFSFPLLFPEMTLCSIQILYTRQSIYVTLTENT